MSLSARFVQLLREDPVCIVDVGARGGLIGYWERIREHCVFVGFEPEPKEADRLSRQAAGNERYMCRALFSSRAAIEFHHCVVPARSSIYAPDPSVVAALYGTAEHYRIVRSDRVDVTTLDELTDGGEFPLPDFMKLDTQGSELDIMKGAKRVLAGTLIGVETEVEFIPIYQGQPLFSDVDAFLRSSGYELMRFRNMYSRADLRFGQRGERGYKNAFAFLSAWLTRLVPPHGSWVGFTQMVYADAIYVRRVDRLIEHLRNRGADALTAVLKAVVLATELRLYQYGSDIIQEAVRTGLIGERDRGELDHYMRSRSRDLGPLWGVLLRQSKRLFRRLRSPQRRRTS